MFRDVVEEIDEKIIEQLTSQDDIMAEEKNIPISGLVHGAGMDHNNQRFVSLVLSDTSGVTVRVEDAYWPKWKDIAVVGKVIEVVANIGMRTPSGSLSSITSKQTPVAVSDKVHFIIRTPLPSMESDNMMVSLDYVRHQPRPDNAKANAPDTFACRTSGGEYIYVKSWSAPCLPHLKKLLPDSPFNLGPVKYVMSVYDGKPHYELICNRNTVVYSKNSQADHNPNAVRKISKLMELHQCKTGQIVSLKAIVLRDVCDQATHLIDREPGEVPYRVCLSGLKSTFNIKRGDGVKIKAKVLMYDVVHLECVSAEADIDDEEPPVDLKLFKYYKPLIIRYRTPSSKCHTPSSPASSINSSQESDNSRRCIETPKSSHLSKRPKIVVDYDELADIEKVVIEEEKRKDQDLLDDDEDEDED